MLLWALVDEMHLEESFWNAPRDWKAPCAFLECSANDLVTGNYKNAKRICLFIATLTLLSYYILNHQLNKAQITPLHYTLQFSKN